MSDCQEFKCFRCRKHGHGKRSCTAIFCKRCRKYDWECQCVTDRDTSMFDRDNIPNHNSTPFPGGDLKSDNKFANDIESVVESGSDNINNPIVQKVPVVEIGPVVDFGSVADKCSVVEIERVVENRPVSDDILSSKIQAVDIKPIDEMISERSVDEKRSVDNNNASVKNSKSVNVELNIIEGAASSVSSEIDSVESSVDDDSQMLESSITDDFKTSSSSTNVIQRRTRLVTAPNKETVLKCVKNHFTLSSKKKKFESMRKHNIKNIVDQNVGKL
ncbi:hypothetical protein LOTGIDRAFT_177057 [Lottia gigantea]|uniref:CCHC-type domain-containing protein n=1 Tax=Lottia gigantea TaxID=225164 RepID=V4AZ29_LOTGI|nr:hypothetical protein LOTGIDRAFT_177057 [Lottia gigantea]ESP00366.1 hypothetical protein LOTGIDRAFT_177057 [Lottia gigantea]